MQHNKTMYIHQLNLEQIKEIKLQLEKQGIQGEDLQSALDSRLSDLEEVIDINKILNIK